ncbi:Protein GPR107 [Zea mays]|uniref:Protein GPR107 n=1 Tax=Zea mays TaxID=4577 RepID=A0A3L6DPX9_MAIZE|nr:Protein GPR107 [Zea mays]
MSAPVGRLLLLVSAVAVGLALPVAAEIKKESFREDPRSSIMFEKFGFSRSGEVRITVSGASVSSPVARADLKQLGFFLLSDESLLHAIDEAREEGPTPEKLVAASDDDPDDGAGCVLDSPSPYVRKLFTFKNMKGGHYNRSFPVTRPDEYALFFANCAPGSLVSMTVRTEMYNVGADGSKDYLPVGQAPLPAIHGVFALCYAAFLAAWGYLTLSSVSAQQIHHLMSGLLAARLLYCVSAAEDQHHVRATGTPHGWDHVALYLFQLVKGVVLFALVGTGWSFLKPVLQGREKKVLVAVIPLQVAANVVGEAGPSLLQGYWATWWNRTLLLVDVACCCAVLFPVVWSHSHRETSSKTDGKAARNLSRLTLFRRFYAAVIGYLYFARVVVYALRTAASYRPAEKSHYFCLHDDDDDDEMVLREEELEL